MKLQNGTIINRRGNKGKLLQELFACFPTFDILVEPFAGTLAVSLYALHSYGVQQCICNDIDNQLYNLWNVLKESKDELIEALLITPYHVSVFQEFKQHIQKDPIWQAVQFLYRSNFSYFGGGDTFRVSAREHKREILLSKLRNLYVEDFSKITFLCCDFRKIFAQIYFSGIQEKAITFTYNDPPYLGTNGNYQGFTEQDFRDLLETNLNSGIRFAISEFASPLVLEIIQDYPVTVHYLKERQTLKNRNQEILIYAGYEIEPLQIPLFIKN